MVTKEKDVDLMMDLFDFGILGRLFKTFRELRLPKPLFLTKVLEYKLETQYCKGLLMTIVVLIQLDN
jgi:hypothetical protein